MADTGTIAVGETKHLKATIGTTDIGAGYNYSQDISAGGVVQAGAVDADGHLAITGITAGVATINGQAGSSQGSIEITVSESALHFELI